MSLKTWEELYQAIRRPPLPDTVTGFNMNLDRIITVTGGFLRSPLLSRPDLAELKTRLINSMQYSTAGEWIIDDPERYQQIARCFFGMGSCTIGGQAGIAALHLSRLGVNRVVCAAPLHGQESAAILDEAGVFLSGSAAHGDDTDKVHLVFEYPPGLVSLAPGALPRNNRFIVSPVHEPSSVIVPGACMDRFLADIAPCNRAFLSGYQYLHTGKEFSSAACALAEMRAHNPLL
ncbi:MAG TPA: ADP-dependent glucokinase/phosphofructokinase, partial [Methanoregula sp.]|nr:ADP-dependent glucokinase/phosphofructokinase [Methanoregula sp.]